jgi:uncharacterized protein YcsI (UPF0317 family)
MTKKPVCDCGAEFEYEIERVIPFVRYKIKKDGTLYKYPTKLSDVKARHGEDYGMGFLICDECDNQYEFDMVDKGVVIRGDRIHVYDKKFLLK